MHIQVAFLDLQIQRCSEQVFDLTLLALEKLLISFDFLILATRDRRLEKPRGWKLARIGGDPYAMRAGQHGQRLFQAALRGLVEDHDVKERLPREDLGNRLGAGHPDGTELEERIATLGLLPDRYHLPQTHRALAAEGKAAFKIGAQAIKARPSAGQQARFLDAHPLGHDRWTDVCSFLLVPCAVAL